MSENVRTIEGVVMGYDKAKSGGETKSGWARLPIIIKGHVTGEAGTFEMNNETRGIFLTAGSKEDAVKEAEGIKEEAPIGSLIQMKETKKGDYWNFNAGTFKVITKGDGKVAEPVPELGLKIKGNSGIAPVNSGDQLMWSLKELRELRLRCLNNATALAAKGTIETDEITEVAGTLIDFVYDGMTVPVEEQPEEEPDGSNETEEKEPETKEEPELKREKIPVEEI